MLRDDSRSTSAGEMGTCCIIQVIVRGYSEVCENWEEKKHKHWEENLQNTRGFCVTKNSRKLERRWTREHYKKLGAFPFLSIWYIYIYIYISPLKRNQVAVTQKITRLVHIFNLSKIKNKKIKKKGSAHQNIEPLLNLQPAAKSKTSYTRTRKLKRCRRKEKKTIARKGNWHQIFAGD